MKRLEWDVDSFAKTYLPPKLFKFQNPSFDHCFVSQSDSNQKTV